MKKAIPLTFVATASLFFAACGDDDDTPTNDSTADTVVEVTTDDAGDPTVVEVTTADSTATADDGTTADAGSTAGLGANDAIVEGIQTQLASSGIDVTEEQAACHADNVANIDMSDMAATMEVIEGCGISAEDLANANG